MTSAPLSKIEQPPKTLRDIVQEKMRDAIIEGHFKPGERLVERTLCDQLGVSRTVVRETIRYLEAEGLVDIRSGRGPIVARLNWQDARQIYEIRLMLESAAARNCAVNISPERARKLRTLFLSLKGAFKNGTTSDLLRATSLFYKEIFEGAGHHVAWEVVQRLNARISRLRMMTLSLPDRETPGLVHMQRIYEAIADGNAAAAEYAVAQHLEDAKAIAERGLAASENGFG